MSPNLPLVVGISGASGVIYGIRLLEILRDLDIPRILVMSRSAEVTLAHETDRKVAEVRALATTCYAQSDIGASIASGSFRTRGMVVAPCSIRSMAEIARDAPRQEKAAARSAASHKRRS